MSAIDSLKQFLIKHKERVALAAMGLVFILFVIGGIYLQRTGREEKVSPSDEQPQRIELKVPEGDVADGSQNPENASYFLKPSPRELLDQLTSMENLNEDVVEKKYKGFRVLWPLYFFNITENDGGKLHTALFDVSEDGFGTLVQSIVDVKKYPELQEMVQGTEMWVGGEIIAVDLSGTGTIYLQLEQLGKDKGGLMHVPPATQANE